MSLNFQIFKFFLLLETFERNDWSHLLLLLRICMRTKYLCDRRGSQRLPPLLCRRKCVSLTVVGSVVALVFLGGAVLLVVAEKVLINLAVDEILKRL